MFAYHAGKLAVRRIKRLFSNTLNLILLSSLLLSGCGPSMPRTQPDAPVSIRTLDTTENLTVVQPNDFTPPVFTRPEANTVDRANLSDNSVQSNVSANNPKTVASPKNLLMFIENAGQYDPQVRFRVSGLTESL